MSKVIIKGYVLIPEQDLQQVIEALPQHKELSLQETGCLVFDVEQDKNQPNRINVYEEYTDKEAFEFHRNRMKESEWGKVTVNIERHIQIIDNG